MTDPNKSYFEHVFSFTWRSYYSFVVQNTYLVPSLYSSIRAPCESWQKDVLTTDVQHQVRLCYSIVPIFPGLPQPQDSGSSCPFSFFRQGRRGGQVYTQFEIDNYFFPLNPEVNITSFDFSRSFLMEGRIQEKACYIFVVLGIVCPIDRIFKKTALVSQKCFRHHVLLLSYF